MQGYSTHRPALASRLGALEELIERLERRVAYNARPCREGQGGDAVTWALVQWDRPQFVPIEELDVEELADPPPDLELVVGVDDQGRRGFWRFLGGPDVTVGFPDEPSARRYVHEHGLGNSATSRDPSCFDDGASVLVTDDVDTWVELATFVNDVRDDDPYAR